ncbi:hypothetical protein [Stutzerimonas nitrititolerans]|uniref:hypothetical protein n=1 Tax=Stutzerimonas nitrititolerans TaxID=2482751 RepID=UPI0028AF137E|nr:hypothetical protein [Stutzerimonas nitrititolerans]
MLLLRMKGGVTYMLDRQVGSSSKHGIWEFHRSASSFMNPPDYTPYRHAAVSPAEPKVGATVQMSICKPNTPESDWIPIGEGVVALYTAGQ